MTATATQPRLIHAGFLGAITAASAFSFTYYIREGETLLATGMGILCVAALLFASAEAYRWYSHRLQESDIRIIARYRGETYDFGYLPAEGHTDTLDIMAELAWGLRACADEIDEERIFGDERVDVDSEE